MTRTGRWLDARRAELARQDAGAGLLLAVGWVLAALAAGIWLVRHGGSPVRPASLLAGWGLVVGAAAAGAARLRRILSRRADPGAVAALVERAAGLRQGSVAALASSPRGGSLTLASLADHRTAEWLRQHGRAALAPARRERRRALAAGGLAALAGGVLFATAGPTRAGAADFWRPLAALARARGPVQLEVDRLEVPRGGAVQVTVAAPGRRTATLWVRQPGESWRPHTLALDSSGRVSQTLGPLDSDRYLRASSGGRESAVVHVRVSLPALLADLALMARYPAYLDMPDQPLVPGPEAIVLPVGSEVEVRGRTTVPLRSAGWQGAGRTRLPLRTEGTGFEGRLPVKAGGTWLLVLEPAGHVGLEGPPPELHLVAVADSLPVIAVPVPGGDTTAPLSLRQPLVIDVRDDHRVTRVEVATRRVSRWGLAGASRTDTLSLPEGGAARVLLQWTLDLNGKGYLPGDTAFYRVRAFDGAPRGGFAQSREYRLRLPSQAELRAALRQASGRMIAAADSLAAEQRGLAQETEELSAARERASSQAAQAARGSPAAGDVPFGTAARAAEIAARQQAVAERARELSRELAELEQAASTAGLTDPQWQAELRELEALLKRAVTPELERRLAELSEALRRLDPEELREALKRLAAAGQEFRQQLARSRELFERAALEGAMTTLAEDARELAAQQRDWNRRLEQAKPDSALAAAERALAQATDSLAAQLEGLEQAVQRTGGQPEGASAMSRQANQAAGAMQQAAAEAALGRREPARQAGGRAQEALDPIAQQLMAQRDALRQQWRQDVLSALDHALSETAGLAQRQMALAERMRQGDGGADVRSEQAALREGADRVLQRLQQAAGKNALVSPQIGSSLGFARLRMTEAVDRLQRAVPDPGQASELAGQAVDGLNAMTQALLRSRADVAGAQSGSGLQEAVEKMAQLAAEQQALNGRAGGMLPLMPLGGEGLLQDLRALAAQQRRLAAELERLGAQADSRAAQELAQEARDIARRLEQGQLDRRTVERQERLFRRLLDQGRTLRGDEEDETKERVSRTARPDNVRLPPALKPGEVGQGPRYPYPSWEQLQQLPAEQRRLVLDYFRRLNEGRP